MKKDKLPQKQLGFKCHPCDAGFKSSDYRTEPKDGGTLPYDFYAPCPLCDKDSPLAFWQVGQLKIFFNGDKPGPKTPEGIAAVTKNLEGHPTPAEAKITRMNAMVHGLHSTQIHTFPARPGKYPECQGCELNQKQALADGTCKDNKICTKKTELMLMFLHAFDSSDPKALNDHHAIQQAKIHHIFDGMLNNIIQDGDTLKRPFGGFNKDGEFRPAFDTDHDGNKIPIMEITTHPTLKPMIELLQKNNLSLSDLGMTNKVQEDQEISRGFLEDSGVAQETIADFMKRSDQLLGSLSQHRDNAEQLTKSDPALRDYLDDEDEP